MYQEKELLYGLFQLSQRDRESIPRSITPVITASLSSYDSFGTALDTFSGLSPTSAAGAHLAQVPGGDADDDTHDLRAEPLAAEAAHYAKKDDGAPPRRSVIPRTRHETNGHR
ncbi:Pre-mRNA-splicing factor [Colletotrichum higginsianum IMI 349063]|uniref:Pre-mRNA-splicing factor n=1 Tax=Colletotrichum higginsianum (strain IMI 349063) TaxID=759273 RepID=A0A1B7Y9F7_COLHI|nr:Pre-mRNA-splicing factor [Colletotrichum higginsianum IMI 349063]OBR08614.1 Pre-mRNA-splicing factor [Colletotrichum higginsianum IMI 349063]